MNIKFNIEQARANMIKQQLRTWDVLDESVLEVIKTVPREQFTPERLRKLAFADMEIPLGHDQIMMTPKVEGRMIQALDIQNSEQVLEIGTGSGFTAACMARLGEHVETVDIYPDFTAAAERNLAQHDLDNVSIQTGDASQGWNPETRYDIIAVTGSIPEYDDRFERSLKVGGRLFIVVGQAPVMEAMLIMRSSETQYLRTKIFETLLPALVNTTVKPKFIL